MTAIISGVLPPAAHAQAIDELSIAYLGFYYQYINYPGRFDDHELGVSVKFPGFVAKDKDGWTYYPCLLCTLMQAAI
ncbi:MAG: hypothetical protein HY897_03305 [Deltaproteobacteria bacterium]|nr:hypothetical protein [Deltaproteobacteria bacterium]